MLSGELCILTSFWVLRASKSWLKYFFGAVFKLFCSFQTFFNYFLAEKTFFMISAEKSMKNIWNEHKRLKTQKLVKIHNTGEWINIGNFKRLGFLLNWSCAERNFTENPLSTLKQERSKTCFKNADVCKRFGTELSFGSV